MPQLVPTLRVQIADPVQVYGIETAHDASYTDAMRDLSRRNPAMEGIRYDAALDCLMLAPEYKPVDTPLSACTHVGGVWKEAVTRATGVKAVMQVAPDVDVQWSYTQGESPTVAVPDGGGLWITVGKSGPCCGPAGNATIDASHCYVRIRLMATAELGYRIVWAFGEGPRVERTEDAGAHWLRLGDIPVGDASKAAHGAPELLRFQVLRANGRIVFRATASNAVNETALAVPDLDLILPIEVTGMNVCASILHFTVTYPAAGMLASNPRQRDWANDTEPDPVAVGSVNSAPDAQNAPDGITLSMMGSGGAAVTQYQAVFVPRSSTTVTPYLTHVQVRMPAVARPPVPYPAWTDIGYVLGFDLQQAFLPEQLTVRRAGSVTARNNPQGTPAAAVNMGLYATAHGMCAVRVIAGLSVVQDDGRREQLWEAVRFAGWLNAESITTPWEWTAELTDRIEWELQTPLCADVQFDGACIYHTAKALAERAGFLGGWYAPVPGIPDAWTCDGTTCDPATHIRLGQGTVANPSFAYTADQTIWEALQDIALKYGMLCGVASDGRFEFRPFMVEGARSNWRPRQIFSAVPGLSGSMPCLNEFVGELRKHVSLKGVRNSTTLIGMDRDWRLFASHQMDAASIVGNGTPSPPVNFLGRLRPYVDSSSRYYDAAATDVWCEAKHNLLRQPRVWFDPLDCWPQPLAPLDYIGITANWTLPGDDRFYIGSMEESIRTLADPSGAVQTYSMRLYPELVPY